MLSFVAGAKLLQDSGVHKILVDPCNHPEGMLLSYVCDKAFVET